MKRYINYYLAIVLTFSFSNCSDDFLNFVPEDQATVGTWYRNAQEIRMATASLYGRPWWQFTDVFQWCAGDLLPGDLLHVWDEEGAFFMLSQNESNRHILDGWRGLYNVVSYANLIIDDMPAIAGGSGVSADVINAGLAEARFFRAAAYFQLVEYWGEVPIVENPAAKVATNNLQLPRNTLSSIYEFIRRDLVFAAEHLHAVDDPGRVTSWAAKGMLAKLHVTLGQRSVGGGSIGSANDFTIAADYATDVINNSGRSLFANYEDMFKVANERNPEVLFSIQCINGGWGFGSSRQARFGRNIELTGDGTAWGDGKCITYNFVNNLNTNAGTATDLRRKAIYMNNGDFYNYVATENGGYTYEIVVRDEEGVAINGATPTLNSLKKHIVGNENDHGFTITNQDSPFDIYMLRLADVYLLLAEAELAGGTTLNAGSGLNAFNAVRERAGLNPRTSATYEQIFNERRVEFGLESQGWLDVKRRYYRNSQQTLDYLNSQGRAAQYYRILEETSQENDPAGYELVYSSNDNGNPSILPPGAYLGAGSRTDNENELSINSFTGARMIIPIPVTEAVANPKLKEEPQEYVFN